MLHRIWWGESYHLVQISRPSSTRICFFCLEPPYQRKYYDVRKGAEEVSTPVQRWHRHGVSAGKKTANRFSWSLQVHQWTVQNSNWEVLLPFPQRFKRALQKVFCQAYKNKASRPLLLQQSGEILEWFARDSLISVPNVATFKNNLRVLPIGEEN